MAFKVWPFNKKQSESQPDLFHHSFRCRECDTMNRTLLQKAQCMRDKCDHCKTPYYIREDGAVMFWTGEGYV